MWLDDGNKIYKNKKTKPTIPNPWPSHSINGTYHLVMFRWNRNLSFLFFWWHYFCLFALEITCDMIVYKCNINQLCLRLEFDSQPFVHTFLSQRERERDKRKKNKTIYNSNHSIIRTSLHSSMRDGELWLRYIAELAPLNYFLCCHSALLWRH